MYVVIQFGRFHSENKNLDLINRGIKSYASGKLPFLPYAVLEDFFMQSIQKVALLP